MDNCLFGGDGGDFAGWSGPHPSGGPRGWGEGGWSGLWPHPSQADLFPVSAQMAGLLCEEEVLEVDNVKYCGYCKYHFSKMVSLLGQGTSGSVSHTL